MSNFFEKVLEVLKQDDRFFSVDGKFLRNAALEAGYKLDKNLLKLLLSDADTEKHFFEEVDGVKIFDKIRFGWVVNNRQFLHPQSHQCGVLLPVKRYI